MRLLPFDLYVLSDSIEAGLVLDDAGLSMFFLFIGLFPGCHAYLWRSLYDNAPLLQ